MAETLIKQALKGGEFLIRESSSADTFIPEEFNEEQKMMAQMAEDFINNDVLPVNEQLDHQEEGLMVKLMNKAGELGLLGATIPEEYGGFGKDFITGTLLTEKIGAGGSFAVACAAHTGIGTLPILYFGNPAQRKKYIPKLASGEMKAAYCLTEPGSGSDALAAKTNAKLSADGKYYLLNGQKMWITNGGFADVFIVFAKIDGEKFTGFIVEANSEGLTRGEEEKKMGIKGSSTRQIFFQDVKVPVENLLGEIGKGHLIAFNILNIGRLKLCAAAMGATKRMATISVEYATQREQFKHKISDFGAIKYKLAEQAIKIFTVESAMYRASKQIEEKAHDLIESGLEYPKALMGAAEEFAIECAILKVYGSEMLDYVVDEAVQIHGGLGFSEEYTPARAYRDSRINRIFEGTNEINRLLTVDMLLKRALKGQLDLMTPAMNIQKELMSIPDFISEDEAPYATQRKQISNMKKGILMVAGAAVQKLMMALESEQELLMNVANMISETYLCESLLLRVMKMNENGMATQEHNDILNVNLHDAADRFHFEGRNALATFAEGDELRMMLLGLKRFSKTEIVNTKECRRRIAARLIDANKYCF